MNGFQLVGEKEKEACEFELNFLYRCNGLTMDTVAVDPTEFQNIDVLEHFENKAQISHRIHSNEFRKSSNCKIYLYATEYHI